MVVERAYAKVNLTLDVIEKLENGYHRIESVMHKVNVCDTVSADKAEYGILFKCNPKVCDDEENIAYLAAKTMIESYGISKGLSISVTKNIPYAAGLAGGSSDAAATIRAIDGLFGLNMTKDQMNDFSRLIGSDVRFCISQSSAALVNGIGDDVMGFESNCIFYAVVAKPDFGVCTKEAYGSLDYSKTGRSRKSGEMIRALCDNDIGRAAEMMHNDFEYSVLEKHPEIKEIKDMMISSGALNAIMSGSGSAVFGIAEDEKHALSIKDRMKESIEFGRNKGQKSFNLESLFVCRSF